MLLYPALWRLTLNISNVIVGQYLYVRKCFHQHRQIILKLPQLFSTGIVSSPTILLTMDRDLPKGMVLGAWFMKMLTKSLPQEWIVISINGIVRQFAENKKKGKLTCRGWKYYDSETRSLISHVEGHDKCDCHCCHQKPFRGLWSTQFRLNASRMWMHRLQTAWKKHLTKMLSKKN